MKESVIKLVLDNNWADLNKYVESAAAKKIKSKIDQKKTDIVKAINEDSDLGEIASPKQIDKLEALLKSTGYRYRGQIYDDKRLFSYINDENEQDIIVSPYNVEVVIKKLEAEYDKIKKS